MCPVGETCDPQGRCVPDLCADANCPSGQRCNPTTGACEADPCGSVFCDIGERCFEGTCIDDPCALLDCPQYFHCEVIAGVDGEGNPMPVARCHVDDAYWVPGSEGDELLATGPGGCRCAAGPGDRTPDGGALLLLLLLLWAGVVRVTRKAAPRQGGGR